MWQQMRGELLYFCVSVLLGMLAAVLSHGLDRLRKKWRKKPVRMGLLDMGYWLFFCTAYFLLCIYYNEGILRGYALAGVVLGVIFTFHQLHR